MKPQTKPTPWSCIGTAFAMVLDIPVSDLFGIVGHDGSEIAFPALSDPMARRGLHIQECIAACVKLGYAVTPIELFPVIRPTLANGHAPHKEDLVVLFGDDESANWRRFEQTIKTSTGVLEGVGRRCLHAVAYDQGVIFDPDGDHYVYSRPACESRGFRPRRAWQVNHLFQEPSMRLPYDRDLTNKITQSSDHERNERLYPRVMAGDEQAREEMITSNMPLVVLRVNSFIQRNPQLAHLRDDLHSAGFTGLVQAVNKTAEGSDIANPNSYISVAISREIAKLAEKEAVHIGIELVNLLERDPLADTESADSVPEVSHNIPESVVDTNRSAVTELSELRDLIESCCETDEERTLIRMREEGYADRDIADALSMPHTAAYTLRRELEQRFQKKLRELED
jgi:hypothetical protein